MKLCVFGSQGRMGKLVREEAGDSVIACYDARPPGRSPVEPLPGETDVVIDFSLPSAWHDLDTLLSSGDAALVSGTTGLGPSEEKMLRSWSRQRPVFYSSNMSRGIYVLGKLLKQAALMLKDQFSLEIVEYHHSGKVDSPSGTALTLAEIWRSAEGGGELVMGRSGPAGPREDEEIGIHSVRGGDVTGDHELNLLGQGERLCLSHSATGRRTFALGALRAAQFLRGMEPGLYGMEDMMNKRKEDR